MFNNFLNTYLICHYSTFTKKVIKTQHNYKHWITTGIKTSCKRKGNFYFYADLVMIPTLKSTIKDIVKLYPK